MSDQWSLPTFPEQELHQSSPRQRAATLPVGPLGFLAPQAASPWHGILLDQQGARIQEAELAHPSLHSPTTPVDPAQSFIPYPQPRPWPHVHPTQFTSVDTTFTMPHPVPLGHPQGQNTPTFPEHPHYRRQWSLLPRATRIDGATPLVFEHNAGVQNSPSPLQTPTTSSTMHSITEGTAPAPMGHTNGPMYTDELESMGARTCLSYCARSNASVETNNSGEEVNDATQMYVEVTKGTQVEARHATIVSPRGPLDDPNSVQKHDANYTAASQGTQIKCRLPGCNGNPKIAKSNFCSKECMKAALDGQLAQFCQGDKCNNASLEPSGGLCNACSKSGGDASKLSRPAFWK
ncbi:hypothetical protein BC834DRAFT_601739 [Gloeopeniophorella convolvens]|nr:hypothetical protein BC834DRAFT_601739 [Gloeopeniophorella convolvens]